VWAKKENVEVIYDH